MKIQETIEKAIEGGWKDEREDGNTFADCLIDHSFWQSLGKALGWKPRARDEVQNMPSYEWEYQGAVAMYSWEYYWHRLIDHLADGKTIETYFESL